jgi:UDP:flavonoid glycosyltransferase YjiC (YdhE family)
MRRGRRVTVVTWAAGGNVPPLLAAGAVLRARGHDVHVLASEATKPMALHAGFPVVGYWRASGPDELVEFERQAAALAAAAAGLDVALDVRDRLTERPTDLAIVDCMLPAAASAAEAAGTPSVALVHFLYGMARRLMLERGGTWTTDLAGLNATRDALGLGPLAGGPAAFESTELTLVTAPRWLDHDAAFPANVIHAGPLGLRAGPRRGSHPPRVLLSFSTTVMSGQLELIRNVCDAVAQLDATAVLTLGPAISAGDVDAPPNVTVEAFGDHDELLSTCAAVVTHAGLGTTLRALAHGVPLLMLPLGRDQHLNAVRVSELGAGIRLAAGATPRSIRGALSHLLAEPHFAERAEQIAARIAHDRPDDRAVDACERVAHSRRG